MGFFELFGTVVEARESNECAKQVRVSRLTRVACVFLSRQDPPAGGMA